MNARPASPRWAWLPPIGSWKYHALLLSLGMLVLGPLSGLTSAYMTFSLGFFVGGQVLAGILGSLVTLGYGEDGKHGANLIQTTAASVAGMSAMAGLIQALVWLGLPQPPLLPLMLYMLCIGMFGAGVGMLYTPLLVDRLQLTYPSGLAVANILRALTDKVLLRRSIARLAGGIGVGLAGSVAGATVPILAALDLSMSTLGAGMVVGSRIAIPALMGGLVFTALSPLFVSIGWLAPGDPYRKISFIIAVGALLGAAVVDISKMGIAAVGRLKALASQAAKPSVKDASVAEDWKSTNTLRLGIWTAGWAAAIVVVGTQLLNQPYGYLLLVIGLVFVFALINGIAQGISDFSPISASAVITILIMTGLGLRDPMIGLMAITVMLVATTVAADMQQDRSTGWRLGTNRVVQFRYQVSGIAVGAIAAVGFAQLFLSEYPVLKLDQTVMAAVDQPSQWTSAATYKIVGILRSLAEDGSKQRVAIGLGVAIGCAMQILRRWVKSRRTYQKLASGSGTASFAEWAIDTLLLPSPFAFFFGGFVNLAACAYFAAGGTLASLLNWRASQSKPADDEAIPSDMSTTSLVGGGLIAGESLAALTLGIGGLVSLL